MRTGRSGPSDDGALRARIRRKLNEDTLAECRRSYEALFGKPWDPDEHAGWLSWLRQSRTAEKDALRAIAKLRKGVEAVTRFSKAQAPRHEEHRRGLRVERDIREDGTVKDTFYLDAATLPGDVSEEIRSADVSTPVVEFIFKLTNPLLIPTDWDYSTPVPGAVPGTSVELSWSSRAVDFSPAVLAARLLQGTLGDVRAVLEISPKRQTPVAWEGSLAVVARFDRTYGLSELRERRGKHPSPNKLTDTELAIISILVRGRIPNLALNKLARVSNAIDAATRPIARARKSIASYEAAKTAIPRTYEGSIGAGQPGEIATGNAAT